MPERLLAQTHALLARVDALPPAACGTFVVGDETHTRGMVLVEANRVCWAMAFGLEHRLRELLQLASSLRLDDRELGLVFATCRDQGRSFANELVARHLVTPSAMREVLRDHSIESLTSLCGYDDPIAWIARRVPLHAPAGFTPAELLAAVGARLYATEAESAHDSFHPAEASGAGFAIGDDGDPVVVREVDGDRLGVTTLLELGTWATAALEVTRGFSAAQISRALSGANRGVAVGWRTSRRVVHAAMFDDPATLSSAMVGMESRRYPIVVSACAPWRLKVPGTANDRNNEGEHRG
jgi:hypothetical protein